jgi:hypothetical protein
MGRSRRRLTRKISAVVDTKGLPIGLAPAASEAPDNQRADQTPSLPEVGNHAARRSGL